MLNIPMHLMSFDIDGAERPCRTHILTGAAANAHRIVHSRNHGRGFVVGIAGNHHDGSNGAVTRTVAAVYAIGQHYAVFLNPYGMPNDHRGLLGHRNGFDGTRRANTGALDTFGTAGAALKAELGLHESGGIT